MNISEKIAAIRREPENVRMRYVWGSVALSMLIIFSIWIFSINAMFKNHKDESPKEVDSSVGITEQLKNLKQQAPSFNDYTGEQLKTTTDEGITPQSDIEQQAKQTEDTTHPQTNAYENLPAASSVQ
jgi:hypothetical protein